MIIDVHAHFLPPTFPPAPPGVPVEQWPVMEPLADGRARMLIGGKEFRIFEPAYWDVPGRIAYMDQEGITMQVLSPLPELLGYWFDTVTTEAMADHVHQAIAAAVATSPKRLAGLGMLPLQDVDRSIAVAHRAKSLGLRGFLVASNVNGVSLADARFEPLYAELEKLGLPLLIHGYRPAGTERFLGTPMLSAIVGVPQESMALIASFIMTDILGRFPALKLGFVHGGGAFGSVLSRMDHVWHEFPEMRELVSVSPRDYIRRFFFDTVTFSSDYLRYLVEAYGPDVLMAGTDGPTLIGQRNLAGFVAEATDDKDVAEKVLWRNAVRCFGLEDIVDA